MEITQQNQDSNSFRRLAHRTRSQRSMERKKKRKAEAEVYIHGNWVLTNNAARAVLKKMEIMAKKGITYGKEAAIQSLLNEAYSRMMAA